MAITQYARPRRFYSYDANWIDGGQLVNDAAGESCGIIGQIYWEDGGNHLVSSGGAYIIWRSGTANTFNNGGTELRIGLQDVDLTTGLEDGTWDTYASLTGGTDSIGNSSWIKSTIDTGSRTYNHLELIALVGGLQSRGGADSVTFRRMGLTTGINGFDYPYGTGDTGTLAKANAVLTAIVVADDGTVGWIDGTYLPINMGTTSVAYNSGSTPDEYIASWEQEDTVEINALLTALGGITSVDTYELILYSSPFTGVTVVETLTPDTDVSQGATAPALIWRPFTPVTLSAGTVYGIALRPTTANNLNFAYFDLLTGNEALKSWQALKSPKVGSRSNQSGNFSEVQTYFHPFIGIQVSGFDVSSGSGGGLRLAGHGGLAA